jgi:hypothetical protein
MKAVAFFVLMATTASGFGQGCADFYYLQNNKTVVMGIFNKKNKLTGEVTYKMSGVKTGGGVTSSVVNSEMRDEKGKLISSAVTKMQCKAGVLMCDMSLLIPAAQMEQLKSIESSAAVFLDYPGAMRPGDLLPDGNFTVNGQNNIALQVTITERKVEAKESVTTPAGSWECMRITSKQKLTTRISGIGIPITVSLTEWFAPNMGVVKTESKMGKTEITAIK